MSTIVEGEWRALDLEAPLSMGPVFLDAGACYACQTEWSRADDRERHVAGCERLEFPAGTPPEGQCPECGTINGPAYLAAGLCANEGGCRRWGDLPEPEDERAPVLVSVTVVDLSTFATMGDLDDLPF